MSHQCDRAERRGQLSLAAIAVGLVGCVIITASSVYTALKMGSLPWPTIFTSITALVLLRALGHTSLNEANVTQVIMSAGSMVAGGLAFTLPGAWMLGLGEQMGWAQILFVALAGTLLGLVFTALIRRRFVDESDLEYPIGTAAASTLLASRDGGRTAKRLFGSMAVSGAWCAARDGLGVVPQMVATLPIPGVAFGVYASPMLLSVGFLVGGGAAVLWVLGAVLANFGIVVGGTGAGLWDLTTAQGIVSSLGMGLMMGSGLGVVAKDVLPRVLGTLRGRGAAGAPAAGDGGERGDAAQAATGTRTGRDRGALALMVAAAALVVCLGLGLSPVACVVVVLLAFVATIMSAQSVGQTGIDPMEIFGLLVLLAVAALGDSSQVQLFCVAGVVAVACGLAGDVMSDFKTGAIIGTDPRDMWRGQAVGALLGVVVSVVTMVALAQAYGIDAFGPGKQFVAAQASVVATMVSGIPSLPAFALGLGAGFVLYLLGVSSMMLGLGVYLPFYMSLTAGIGALAKAVYVRVCRARGRDEQESEEGGTIVASGLLGGESIVGVLVALGAVVAGMAG